MCPGVASSRTFSIFGIVSTSYTYLVNKASVRIFSFRYLKEHEVVKESLESPGILKFYFPGSGFKCGV